MEQVACLLVYSPSSDVDCSVLALSPEIETRTLSENGKLCIVSWPPGSSESDLRGRLEAVLASTSTDSYVSRALSSSHAACLVSVDGMVCPSCVRLIETTLPNEDAVHGVKVSLSDGEAFVEFDPALSDAQRIASAIDDMGFEAKLISTYTVEDVLSSNSVEPRQETVVISVEGMVCQSCVSNIQTNISEMDGVEAVVVSLTNKNATITYDSRIIGSDRELCAAIEELGFEATCEATEGEQGGGGSGGEMGGGGVGDGVVAIPSSDSEGAESDNPLLSPDRERQRRKKVQPHIVRYNNSLDFLFLPQQSKQQLLPSVQFKKSPPVNGAGAEVSDGSDGSTRKKAVVRVTGMSCSSCVAKIERHLGKMEGEFQEVNPASCISLISSELQQPYAL